jgi:uncharacterized protein DUF5808
VDWELELKAGGLELEVKGWRGLLTFAGVMLLGTAILQEVRLPAEQRTWHGTLFGFVPYDLRPPTLDRLTRALWNPEESAVLVPTAFGVGWTVNAAAVAHSLGDRSGLA